MPKFSDFTLGDVVRYKAYTQPDTAMNSSSTTLRKNSGANPVFLPQRKRRDKKHFIANKINHVLTTEKITEPYACLSREEIRLQRRKQNQAINEKIKI